MKGRGKRIQFLSGNSRQWMCKQTKSQWGKMVIENDYGWPEIFSAENSLFVPQTQKNNSVDMRSQGNERFKNVRTSRNDGKHSRKSFLIKENIKLNAGLDSSDKYIQKMLKEQNISQSSIYF